jgi:hypothetical protein
MRIVRVSRSSITTDGEGARLSMSVQAPGAREAASIAAELLALGAEETRVRPAPVRAYGEREWVVSLTTPPLGLSAVAIRRWKGDVLALVQRRPGCQFLGFKTCQAPRPVGMIEGASDHDDARALARQSQRELVLASLLRRRTGGRRGIVHGRGVPR